MNRRDALKLAVAAPVALAPATAQAAPLSSFFGRLTGHSPHPVFNRETIGGLLANAKGKMSYDFHRPMAPRGKHIDRVTSLIKAMEAIIIAEHTGDCHGEILPVNDPVMWKMLRAMRSGDPSFGCFWLAASPAVLSLFESQPGTVEVPYHVDDIEPYTCTHRWMGVWLVSDPLFPAGTALLGYEPLNGGYLPTEIRKNLYYARMTFKNYV